MTSLTAIAYIFAVSCSSIATGSNYTYLYGKTATTIDYILVNTELAPYVNCKILTPDGPSKSL